MLNADDFKDYWIAASTGVHLTALVVIVFSYPEWTIQLNFNHYGEAGVELFLMALMTICGLWLIYRM